MTLLPATSVHRAPAVLALALLPLCACSGGETVLGERDGDHEVESEADEDVGHPDDASDPDVDGDAGADADADAEACVPNCEGRECGPDECGGTCPPGCGADEMCRTDTGRCSTPFGWVEVSPGSPRNMSQRMVFDSGRGVAVLFGRSSIGPETWEHDRVSWRRVSTPNAPTVESDFAMAYDARRRVVVLFGGWADSGALADTWEYDGASWTRAHPAVSPPGRWAHGMAYDAARGVVVLFGGWYRADDGTPRYLNDTWTYDGASWRQVTTSASPFPRANAAVTYDSARGVIVVFGGWREEETELADTWEYDGAEWSEVITAASPPPRSNAAMAYDPFRGVVELYGGDADGSGLGDDWEYDGRSWSRVEEVGAPGLRSGHSMVFDSERGVTILFGGGSLSPGYRWYSDTWEFDGTSWVQTGVFPQLPPSGPFRMAYDAARARTVLYYGGCEDDLDCRGTWEFDGTDWHAMELAVAPSSRSGFAMAYDAAREVVVLFGGGHCVAWVGCGDFGDTWEYDGSSWTQIAPTASPPRQSGHAMTYDSARGVVVMLGGSMDGGTEWTEGTWEYDGTTWSEVLPATSPPLRTGAAIAFDSARGVVVLFGGASVSGPDYSDTWEYDGTTWTETTAASGPPGRFIAAMTDDSVRGTIVLFGGWREEGSVMLSDTWEYTASGWTEVATGVHPPDGFEMVFDAGRGATVLYTHDNSPAALGATWEYYGP